MFETIKRDRRIGKKRKPIIRDVSVVAAALQVMKNGVRSSRGEVLAASYSSVGSGVISRLEYIKTCINTCDNRNSA